MPWSSDSGLVVEIFAVGKWNGMEFTADDLHSVVEAFDRLGDNHRVPLKFGHNNKQPMTDGQPALGWVTALKVEGDKLFAKFSDVSKLVQTAFAKKMYRNVSVELDLDVTHKGQHYDYVLSGVALLGADIPAVNTLNDLTHYLDRDAAFSVGRRAMFSAIAGNLTQGEINMDLAQLTAKVAELSASLEALTTERVTLAAENAALKAQVAKFEADNKAATEAQTKARIDAKRADVKQLLEDGVKSEAITPAAREQFTKLLRIDDDLAVEALDIEGVKALMTSSKAASFSREQGRGSGQGGTAASSPAEQVAQEIAALLAAGTVKNFADAQRAVFARNPQLARDYINANDKE